MHRRKTLKIVYHKANMLASHVKELLGIKNQKKEGLWKENWKEKYAWKGYFYSYRKIMKEN